MTKVTTTFEEYLDRSEAYFAVVREDGDLAWFDCPERSAKVAARLGLPADTPPIDVRRALFNRHRTR